MIIVVEVVAVVVVSVVVVVVGGVIVIVVIEIEIQIQIVGNPVQLGELGYRFGITKASLKPICFFAESGEDIIICL